MWTVGDDVISASAALRLSAVEGATSLEDFSWWSVVGSRMGREEVESSCSWVAIVEIVNSVSFMKSKEFGKWADHEEKK